MSIDQANICWHFLTFSNADLGEKFEKWIEMYYKELKVLHL